MKKQIFVLVVAGIAVIVGIWYTGRTDTHSQEEVEVRRDDSIARHSRREVARIRQLRADSVQADLLRRAKRSGKGRKIDTRPLKDGSGGLRVDWGVVVCLDSLQMFLGADNDLYGINTAAVIHGLPSVAMLAQPGTDIQWLIDVAERYCP